MGKATDVRPKITMACEDCKERNYITKKNRRNDPVTSGKRVNRAALQKASGIKWSYVRGR